MGIKHNFQAALTMICLPFPLTLPLSEAERDGMSVCASRTKYLLTPPDVDPAPFSLI